MTKILSWNVNSLRIRLAELERIAREENPDVVCLQEVKAKEEDFPFAAVKAAGFEHIAFTAWPATTAWPFFPAVR